ncbi:helix-turn-helix transcriptional regulator [Herbidospora cretacea]|uniref:helix-turn-helix transcriptional regulator n=1 Tax=Herbidospora cretacea TaxID=28444 RepID=UPI000774B1CC|nr:YafY family protein [Herbidospora cretacea]
MKSSRLLATVLLLQTKGRLTAAQLAEELDVSVRTVYRDVEALHAAGVPIYGDAGHQGGYQLVAGYRTHLTGLNPSEAEALFLSGLPGPAGELGMGNALAGAQLKLRAALPPELRAQADRMRARFHLDAPGWYAKDTSVPFLQEVADAVWSGRVLNVRYRRWKTPTDVDRVLEPYGLVLKAGRWYLVAGPGPRTFRVDQILTLETSETECAPPGDFDLPAYWREYQERFHTSLYQSEALVRIDGVEQTLRIESIPKAARYLLSLGPVAEALEPPELRAEVARLATEVAALYARDTSATISDATPL